MSWFTKTVIVEKVVDRFLVGSPTALAIYEAYKTEYVYFGTVDKSLGYYLSCTDAFAAHPGAKVKERKGILLGGEYFVLPSEIQAVKVNKPKRSKGKARAVA